MPKPGIENGNYEVSPVGGMYKGMSGDGMINIANSPFVTGAYNNYGAPGTGNGINDAELQSMWGDLVSATQNMVGPNAPNMISVPNIPTSNLPPMLMVQRIINQNPVLIGAAGIAILILVLKKGK